MGLAPGSEDEEGASVLGRGHRLKGAQGWFVCHGSQWEVINWYRGRDLQLRQAGQQGGTKDAVVEGKLCWWGSVLRVVSRGWCGVSVGGVGGDMAGIVAVSDSCGGGGLRVGNLESREWVSVR